jgi:hypothetical protein
MKRPWTIAIASGLMASLIALVMVAPAAAQGQTKYRCWQDLSVSGPLPGQIVLSGRRPARLAQTTSRTRR